MLRDAPRRAVRRNCEIDVCVEDMHKITPHTFVEMGGAVVHSISHMQARNGNVRLDAGVYVAFAGFVLDTAGVAQHSVITGARAWVRGEVARTRAHRRRLPSLSTIVIVVTSSHARSLDGLMNHPHRFASHCRSRRGRAHSNPRCVRSDVLAPGGPCDHHRALLQHWGSAQRTGSHSSSSHTSYLTPASNVRVLPPSTFLHRSHRRTDLMNVVSGARRDDVQ